MANPLRVLHYGMSANIGGVETFIMNCYNHIDRNKVQFDFLSFTENLAFASEISRLGGHIYTFPSRCHNYFGNIRKLKDFFRNDFEHTILHSHLMTCSYVTPIVLASKTARYSVIVHAHSEYKKGNMITRLLHHKNKTAVRRYSNYLLACSKGAGNSLFGNNLNRSEPIKIINNAIDAQRFRYNENRRISTRSKLGINGKFVIGHVGGIVTAKNHNFLIDVFQKVYKDYPNSILLIVGDGALRPAIEYKVRELGLIHVVRFLGVRDDIADLMQAMDVLVFPSFYEGLPITLIEAQASSLKIIASDSITNETRITDLVDFMSLEQSASEWAAQTLQYANGYCRLDTYDEIIRAGYDIKDSAKWLEEFYLSKVR